MRKIAFVLGSMGRGGAERVISILSRSYAERGYKTDIIVLLSNEVGYELHPTTNVIDFSGNTTSRIKRLPFWVKSIRAYVKEQKPDVVVSFAARINLIVFNAIRGLNTKLIVSERNDPRYDGRSKVADAMTKLWYKKTASVVFQTRRAMEYFPKLDNGVIIPNPISVTACVKDSQPGKIVSVGRLTPQKNQKMLIDAFFETSKNHSNAFLEIYGEGGLREELTNQISSLGLTEKVKLMGNITDVHNAISDASVFCLSSDYEGLSNALLEAMMMGLPCVSTNCAGADEYIKNGENGFIVDVGDKAGFAKALDTLLGDEETRKAFSAKAKESSNAFSLDTVMKMWDDVILGETK